MGTRTTIQRTHFSWIGGFFGTAGPQFFFGVKAGAEKKKQGARKIKRSGLGKKNGGPGWGRGGGGGGAFGGAFHQFSTFPPGLKKVSPKKLAKTGNKKKKKKNPLRWEGPHPQKKKPPPRGGGPGGGPGGGAPFAGLFIFTAEKKKQGGEKWGGEPVWECWRHGPFVFSNKKMGAWGPGFD